MFGRATIRLGIGPHSSYISYYGRLYKRFIFYEKNAFINVFNVYYIYGVDITSFYGVLSVISRN